MFKRGFLLVISFVLLFSFSVQTANAIENRGAFDIKKFDVGIFVKKDATIEVKETINVSFFQRRHGIFRKIPVRYTDRNGFKYNMKLNNFSVLDEKGHDIEFDKYNEGSDVVLQIGDPNLEIIGDMKYIISYKVQRGMRFFENHDEIYWNPIGVGWPTKIHNASSTVYLEEGIDFSQSHNVCFVGGFGSSDEDCTITSYTNREIEFKANRVLDNFEGLTVAVNFPKGFISEPTTWQYFLFFLSDNWVFLIPILIFGVMLYVWYFRGKELELRRANIAQYGPPDDLTPGEVGYLIKEGYSNNFVSADIVNLAVKGYLAISEVELKIPKILKNIKKISGKINIVIMIVFLIFGASFVSTILKDGGTVISVIPVFVFLGVFMLILFVKGKKTFIRNGDSELVDYEIENLKDWTKAKDLTAHERRLLKGLFASKILGKIKLSDKKKFYAHVQMASNEVVKQIKKKGYFEDSLVNNKVIYIVGGIILGFIMFMIGSATQRLDFFLSAILTAFILIVFGVIMSKKTVKGVAAYWHAKGYENYINVAERYRVEFNEKENIFEKTLPYAMVFGNVDKWARAFEGMTQKEPNWYHSSSGMATFHPATFANNLNSGFAKATTTASASPSSSSFGGSSGGGGGGGGGGSW